MATDQLIPFALQHAITGAILYTLYAIPDEIAAANARLANHATDYRYIETAGDPLPLPASRG